MKQPMNLLTRVGASVPVIQAPMAGVSTLQMAVEVTKAGAIGSLPMLGVNLTKDFAPLFEQLREFQEKAGNCVTLNFFAHDYKEQTAPSPQQAENWYSIYTRVTGRPLSFLKGTVPSIDRINVSFNEFEALHPDKFSIFLEKLIAAKPAAVSFHFGVPTKATIERFQRGNVVVMATATSVAEARFLSELGIDVLVLQGYEAGGHRGNFLLSETLDERLSTSALFLQVKRALPDTALVPAGGIDETNAGWFIANGAAAVQIGTMFIPTTESAAPAYIGDQVKAKADMPTIVTLLVSGKPARTLRTPFILKLVEEHEKSPVELPLYGYSYYAFKKVLPELGAGHGFYLAGQNYHSVEVGLTSKAVIEKLSAAIGRSLKI